MPNKPPISSSSTPTKVLLSLVRRATPALLASQLIGVQNMSAPIGTNDPRFDLEGIKQINLMTFDIYRGGQEARAWLEETPLNCSIVREWVEKPTNLFTLRVRMAGMSMGTERYESWRVTFFDEGQAALFKLTWL